MLLMSSASRNGINERLTRGTTFCHHITMCGIHGMGKSVRHTVRTTAISDWFITMYIGCNIHLIIMMYLLVKVTQLVD